MELKLIARMTSTFNREWNGDYDPIDDIGHEGEVVKHQASGDVAEYPRRS